MVNKPKIAGTRAETAVAGFLQGNGHPYAERRQLRGSEDWGDITGCPGLCIEVKVAGKGLKLASWLRETEAERINSRSDYGVLAMKPYGYGVTRVGQWWAAMHNGPWTKLCLEVGIEPEALTLHVLPGNNLLSIGDMMKAFRGAFDAAINPGVSILIKAKGIKDPGLWYRVTTLEQVNALLLKAGYGTPPEGTQTAKLGDNLAETGSTENADLHSDRPSRTLGRG